MEHEIDHVIAGRLDGTPLPDPREVEDWRWESVSAVQAQLAANPMQFTAWFTATLDGLLARGLLR